MMTGTTNGQNGRYSITSVSVPPLRDRESDARVLREAPRDTLWRDELFLSQASILLTESLNATDICEQAVRLPLPYLADWCALHLVTEDAYRGAVPVIICAHVDSGKEPRARTLWQQAVQAAPRSIPSLIRVLRSSERPSPPTIVDVGSAPATHDLRGSPAVRLLERVGLATGLYLPLVAGTRTFGILTFGSATPGRYGPREVALAIAYTSRVAGVLDRAQRYQQAIEMLRVRNVVLAEIAHDLKAPAAHIARNADYARAQCAPLQAHECDAPALQTLSQIEVAAHALSDMLDDLMAMTTQQTGSVAPLRKRETDLVALARQTIADYSHPAECHTLELDAGSLDHMVGYWDAGALRRILDNLLANAVLYSRPERTISLRVWRGEARAEPGSRRREWAYLQVRNEGIGVPAADLPHVFEPFYRGGNVKKTIPGTGIGLTSVQSLVQRHGGRVRMASEPGEGVTLTVMLPLDPVPPAT